MSIYDASKFPGSHRAPADLSVLIERDAKLRQLQKRIGLLERKGFLEGVLVGIRASNTQGARQAYSNANRNDQVRSHSMAFADGWKSAYEHVEKHICDELTLIVAELDGTVVP